MRKVLLGLMVAGVLVCGGRAGLADVLKPDPGKTKSSENLRQVFKGVVAAAEKATVEVRAADKDNPDKEVQVALGTVVGADGFILTKASEVMGREKLQVVIEGKGVEAKVVGVSEPHDLAMLKVEAKGLTVAEFASMKSEKVEVGEWVASAGPGGGATGSGYPIAVGVVSVGRRKISGRNGFLGVALGDAGNKGDGAGAKIEQVIAGSSAEQAGLKVDDVVTAVNGKAVKNAGELVDAVHEFRPGDVVVVEVLRGGKTQEMKATLGAAQRGGGGRPSPFSMMNLMGGPVSKRASDFPAVFQHDTVIRPADCGGPLVDLSGKVIGVNIARAGRTETYALPVDVIEPLIGPLESGKLAPVSANKPGETRPGEKPATQPERGE